MPPVAILRGPRRPDLLRDEILADLFEATARRLPDKAALRFGERELRYGELDALADLAVRLAAARRDVLTLQVLSVSERDFPFDGGHRFRDPETGTERWVDARALRADFLARFGAARAALAARFAAAGMRHTDVVLDETMDAPLRRLFATRAAMEST